jgi:hypothetical protein
MRRCVTDWKKIFTKHLSDKRPVIQEMQNPSKSPIRKQKIEISCSIFKYPLIE